MTTEDPKKPGAEASSKGGGDAVSKIGPISPIGPILGVGKIAIGFGAVIMALLLGGVLVFQFLRTRPLNLIPYTEEVTNGLVDLLVQNQIPKTHIRVAPTEQKQDKGARWNYTDISVEVPESLSVADLESLIRRAMGEKRTSVTGTLDAPDKAGLTLSIGDRAFALVQATAAPPPPEPLEPLEAPPQPPPTEQLGAPASLQALPSSAPPQPVPPQEQLPLDSTGLEQHEVGEPHTAPDMIKSAAAQPRAAIIIDDGGYGGAATEAVLKLDPSFTLAILPNTPHATETAERAGQLGFELMLHMPMEALNAKDNFPGFISADMTAAQMRGITDLALSQIPGAAGINNHTGSKFTASETAMTAFCQGLKDRPLYFIDSHTVANSVAHAVARGMGLRCGVNNVFLDNEPQPDHIRGQLDKLIALCKTNGFAIAIGHFRPETAEVLAEAPLKLKSEGITLVHVSELLP